MKRVMFAFMYSVLAVSFIAFGMEPYEIALSDKTEKAISRSNDKCKVPKGILNFDGLNASIKFKDPVTKSLQVYQLKNDHLLVIQQSTKNMIDTVDVDLTIPLEKDHITVEVQLSKEDDSSLIAFVNTLDTKKDFGKQLLFKNEKPVKVVKYTVSHPQLSQEEQLKITTTEYPTLIEGFYLDTSSHVYKLENVKDLINKIKSAQEVNAIELDVVVTDSENNSIRLIISQFPEQLKKMSKTDLELLSTNSNVSSRLIKRAVLGTFLVSLILYFVYKNNMMPGQFTSLFAKMLPSHFKA